jgi:hypothetical protein
MKKFSLWLFVALVIIAVPLLVLAQATTSVETNPGDVVTGILTAFTGRKWPILVGFILTGIVYVVRTYLLKGWAWAQTSRGGAIVAIGIAILGTLGAELAAGVLSVSTILDALMAAIMSAGGYNLFTKIFVPSKTATIIASGALRPSA